MSKDLFAVIKSIYPAFTRAEKNIADYVLQNAKNMVYMTITELAAECGVGETSIFRFCRRLEKSGYQSFKVDLARAVIDSHMAPKLDNCIVSSHDNLNVMMQKVLNNSMSMLNETYQLLDPIILATATQWLSAAEHICFFGVGLSSVSALESRNRFLFICSKAEYLGDPHMQLVRASMLTASDVAIVFSYSGTTKEAIAIAKAAKDAGARLICISRFCRSPLASLCDLLLLCGGNEGPYQNGSLNVKTAELFLMEVLSIAYCQANPIESRKKQALIGNTYLASFG